MSLELLAISIFGAAFFVAFSIYLYREMRAGEEGHIEPSPEPVQEEEEEKWGWVCIDCRGKSYSNRQYLKNVAQENAGHHERDNPGHRTMLVPASGIQEAFGREVQKKVDELVTDEEPEEPNEPEVEEEHKCECGATFETGKALGGHKSHCPEVREGDGEDLTCEGCERTFDSKPKFNGHLAHCSGEPLDIGSEPEEEPEEPLETTDKIPKALLELHEQGNPQSRLDMSVDCPFECGYPQEGKSGDWIPGWGKHFLDVHGLETPEDRKRPMLYVKAVGLDSYDGPVPTIEPEEGDEGEEEGTEEPGDSDEERDPHDMFDDDGNLTYPQRMEKALQESGETGVITTKDAADKAGMTAKEASGALSVLARQRKSIRDSGYGKWRYLGAGHDVQEEEDEGSEEEEPVPREPRWDEDQACPEPKCGFKTDVPSAMDRHCKNVHDFELDKPTNPSP